MKNNDALLEAKILGALFQAPSLFAQVSHLTPDAFHDSMHATIFECMNGCIDAGYPLTPSSIALNFDQKISAIGGSHMLDQIASQGGDIVTNLPIAVEKLRDMQQWRKITEIAARLQTAVEMKERSPDEVLSGINRLSEQLMSNGRETSRSKHDVARSALERAKEAKETTTTGIDTLDYLMQGGLQSRRLYGIGGLFGRGKTIMLGSISDNLNLQQQPHLFITMETEPEDIEIRACSSHINQNASVIFDQDDDAHQDAVRGAEDVLSKIPNSTYYEYAPLATINDIHRMILRAKSRHGIKGFMLDYWQLIRGHEKGVSRDQHLSECADRLAAICRQENLWGIMTAQIDERGHLVGSPGGLLRSAALYVRLVRDEDAQAAYFVTEKSNYTRYADTGNESVPGMIFDMASGPRFRNAEDMDLPSIAEEQSGALHV
jgi:replicative DNA helicase